MLELKVKPKTSTLNPLTRPYRLGFTFNKAVLLYQAGAVLALLPVINGNWSAGLIRLALVTASVAIYFVVTHYFNQGFRLKWLILAIVGGTALIAILGTAQVNTTTLRLTGINQQIYSLVRRLLPLQGLPQVHQNVLGGFLVSFLPLALAYLIWGRGRWTRLYCGFCALIALIAIVVTSSRSALLGLGAAGLVFIFFLLNRRLLRNPKLFYSASVGILLLTGSVLVVLLPKVENWSSRLQLWNTTLHMISDYPLTGAGLGQFESQMANYGTPDKHAHNLFLQSWAEFGICGLVAILVVLGLTLTRLYGYRDLSTVEVVNRPIIAGTLAGLVAMFANGLLEYGSWGGKFAPAFWLLPALLAAVDTSSTVIPVGVFFKKWFDSRVSLLGTGLVAAFLLVPLGLINLASLIGLTSVSQSLYQTAALMQFWNAGPERNLGRIALANDNPELAQTHYLEALRREPNDLQSLLALAKLAEKQGNFDQAGLYWKKAGATTFLFERAQQEFTKGQISYTAAERDLKLVLEIDPAHKEGLQLLVQLYRTTDRSGEALALLQKLIAKDPDPEMYLQASLLMPSGPQQLDYVLQAIRLDPQNSNYYWHLGNAYQGNGQSDQAEQSYKKSLELKPSFQLPVDSLALLYLSQNRPELAKELLETTLASNFFIEKPVREYVLLVKTYLVMGQTRAALETTQKVLALSWPVPEPFLQLGEALAATGNRDAARAAYSKALEIAPNNAAAQQGLSLLK
jgi:tetratricopeptide (TPR) repeat protein